jgi:Na+-translocating ferredoxin:NAD+ oxidoreductase RNF subunit RnfB
MDVMNIVYSSLSLGGLGLIFGIGLGYASKKFVVEEDSRIALVRAVLPGANCGGCGFAGCDACAKAMVEGEAAPDACSVGGPKIAQQVGEILGVAVEIKERNTAFVKCGGTSECSRQKYEYKGPADCSKAAAADDGGFKGCHYGCLGLGNCVKVCSFGAISVVDGVAVVDEDKCTSCGRCVKECPRALIELVPVSKKVRVSCSSNGRGKEVKDNCTVGCIGCTLCVKACQYGAIVFENNLARVDYEKCTQCMACVQKCPTKSMTGVVSAEAVN